jgi:hypothetical protein
VRSDVSVRGCHGGTNKKEAVMYKRLALPILSAFIALYGVVWLFKANNASAQFTASIQPAATFASLGTAFNYQGHLVDGGQPANGSYDFIFDLYDSETTGTGVLVGNISLGDETVSNGLFSVVLDYGDVFDGTALWLEIRVRPGDSTDAYTTLEPRQALSATPYASYATKAGGVPWSGIDQIPAGFGDDIDDDTLGGLTCANEQIAKWDGAVWSCALDQTGGSSGWSLTGNGGTSAGTNFLGTTDDEPLELRVNGLRAFLLEPDPTSPNIIAGYDLNNAGASTAGATIGGGGRDLAINQVDGDYGTVGGGADNTAGGYASFLGGGESNAASSSYTALGGGSQNLAGGDYAVIGGGQLNTTGADYAIIGAGQGNVVSGTFGTVSGGQSNQITDTFGTIAGGATNSTYADYAVIGGGYYNSVAGAYGTIGGGGPFNLSNPTTTNNQVLDDYGTVSGGGGNIAGSDDGNSTSSHYATVSGGKDNTSSGEYATTGGGNNNSASAYGATIGGGINNSSTSNNAVIAGGTGNAASGDNATVSGGTSNTASQTSATVGGGNSNTVAAAYGTIPGGAQNYVGGEYAAISGGISNTISADYAALGGGQGNLIIGTLGTIAGGVTNTVSADYAAIGGGYYNLVAGAYGTIGGGGSSNLSNPTTTNNQVLDDYGTVSGGGSNVAGSDDSNPTSAHYATVGGGRNNTANGEYATAGGGSSNTASAYGATIGGGMSNSSTSNNAVIAGGTGNTASGTNATVSGGTTNTAGQTSATVSGGDSNTVAAPYGTIPGGIQNFVSGYLGFAAGNNARAEHQGSFVWSDSTGAFTSTANDQFLVDASGGVGIGTNTPIEPLTVGGNAAILGDGRLVARGVVTQSVSQSHWSYPKSFQKPSAIDAAGNYIYVTSWATNTLTTIDISDPDHPKPITYTTSSLHGPLDVQVVGGLAFIASELNDKLVIIDVSDPTKKLKSIGASDPLHMSHPQAVFVSGNHAYVASYGEDLTGDKAGLFIFDVSDPTVVLQVGFTDTNLDGPTDVYVAGDHAYVTSQKNDSLAIFDISDPNNIVAKDVFSNTALLGGPSAVQVRGSYAYVLGEDAGMLVTLDISNPDNITYVGHNFTDLTHPVSLFLSGDYAYVAYSGEPVTAFSCGLAIFDISDPADIQVLSEMDMGYNLPSPEKPVAINGNGLHIYVVNEGHHSVRVYDINHLSAPAVTAGNVQADYLEANVNARVNHNLSVGDGLNVGPGGALIEGQLSVASQENSYILGNLSLGATGFISEADHIQLVYPTHQLDVHGYARFRINDEHSLIMASSSTQGALFDFTSNDYGAYYSPTARVHFEVPNPYTHTTEIELLTQSASDTDIRGRMTIGEEVYIYNTTGPDMLDFRTTISFTNSGRCPLEGKCGRSGLWVG